MLKLVIYLGWGGRAVFVDFQGRVLLRDTRGVGADEEIVDVDVLGEPYREVLVVVVAVLGKKKGRVICPVAEIFSLVQGGINCRMAPSD